ncbi:MAG: histidinol-phosphatase HisJ family protein [Lachnospiraceae bacterium]|nr:histidinol-phosphatase HisJ family protein [Lachnospiraceae bacterium]MBR5583837.1 histidinol-phosphatase HisJ family protein [Lachnospiraceae bacterium]
MILCDYHNHTHFSADCDTPAEQMIEGAIRAGLTHLCITDHMDPDMQFPGLDFTFDLDEYFAKHRMWKEKYKDQINLLTGIELGLQPHIGDDLRQIIAAGPYDFAIGSIHVVDRIDPYFKEYWDGKTEFEGTYRYFENVLDSLVIFHDFDVFGHLDYVVRYGPNKDQNYSYSQYKEIVDEILQILVSQNIGLELNTAGLKYGLSFAHPHMDILKRYRELGGEIITVGSDAHKPEHLAYDFHKVPDILKEAGFSYYTIFKERKPEFIKL